MSIYQSVIDELDALSRTRALTNAESLKLEHAIKRVAAEHRVKVKTGALRPAWTKQETATFLHAVRDGASIQDASLLIGRPAFAGKSRMAVLGLTVADVRAGVDIEMELMA